MPLRKIPIVLTLSLILSFSSAAFGKNQSKDNVQALDLAVFLEKAASNDTEFEVILLDRMPLGYRRDALLPERDFILSLKQQFHYFQGGKTHGSTQVSLSRLFGSSGTRFSANFAKPAIALDQQAGLQALISQPIAKNAFGKAIQMQDQIIGLENHIAEYQVVEAYEDYLAALTTAWYNWYSAYENLKVARTAYRSGEKLLQNILARKRQKIALAVDVNKMKLSLIAKKENLIVLEQIYAEITQLIFSAIREPLQADSPVFVPGTPADDIPALDFTSEYAQFTQSSRTYAVLGKLEQQSAVELDQLADDLLPSTNLLLGYELDGKDWGLREQENSFFAGIELSWPIGRTVDKARHEIKRIEHKKTQLSNRNKHEALRTNLKTLHLQIQRERTLMDVSKQKIQLAQSILKDEAENYSFGKISLNDYIQAVDNVDRNRFSYTSHLVQLHKLHTEWLRLSDRLIRKQDLLN